MIRKMLEEVGASEEHISFELSRCTVEKIKEDSKEGHILIAKVNGEIAGFLWFNEGGGVIKISKIYVEKSFRRKRVATTLLNKLFRIAQKRKAHKITAMVRMANNPAIKFFERVGFVKEGVLRKHYFGVDFAVLAFFP